MRHKTTIPKRMDYLESKGKELTPSNVYLHVYTQNLPLYCANISVSTILGVFVKKSTNNK